jgi:hypothetical protein
VDEATAELPEAEEGRDLRINILFRVGAVPFWFRRLCWCQVELREKLIETPTRGILRF